MQYIWHGRRFWVQNPTRKQHRGWNTNFEKCEVVKVTAKRICINSPTLGILYLNREELEAKGKVYHSKPHEYFYREKPNVDPERPRSTPYTRDLDAILVFSQLGLVYPATRKEVDKAYKKLARQAHPDAGGNHDDFIRLNDAYQLAVKYV